MFKDIFYLLKSLDNVEIAIRRLQAVSNRIEKDLLFRKEIDNQWDREFLAFRQINL